MRLGIASTMMLTAMLLLAGCDGRSRRASARLRTENAAMQQQIETLQARETELEATLAMVESQHEVNAEALGQMPQVAGLVVSPLSGFEPTNDDTSLRLELHVSAQDGRQRPIQLVGSMEAQVLRPVPGRSPEVIATTTLSPSQVRDAWRGGLMGATYRIDVPVQAASIAPDTPVLVHIFHTDARTGRQLETTASVSHHPSTQ